MVDVGLVFLVAFGALSAWVGAMGIVGMIGYELGRRAAFPQPFVVAVHDGIVVPPRRR